MNPRCHIIKLLDYLGVVVRGVSDIDVYRVRP